jgi:hypothetical protein
MLSVDEKWKNFISTKKISTVPLVLPDIEPIVKLDTTKLKFDINISTKTKTLYFNKAIDIYKIFWNIPIVEYSTMEEGVIKKEIKIVNNTKEETIQFEEKLKSNDPKYYIDHILKNIDNPNARKIKYKNQRKLIIGMNKKDILKRTTNLFNDTTNEIVKGAFRNCLVIIIRLLDGDEYKETHVKIFNTGIIKIPGILNTYSFKKITDTIYNIINCFELYDAVPLTIVEEDSSKTDIEKNVLINSNFKCSFNIYLDRLYKILRSDKYNIEVSMDTTTYPALRCKYYYHTETGYDLDKQTGVIHADDINMKWKDLNKSGKYKKISIMIFRTGNGLIMGKICEKLLMFIFTKLKMIIVDEYDTILNTSPFINKDEKKKRDKKIKIDVTMDYYNTVIRGATAPLKIT